MAAQTGITIRVISNKLPALPAELRADVAAEVKTATLGIEAAGKQKAPVRTGTLRRSIHSIFSADGMTGTVGPSVSYAIFVEMGTRHMGARPYMRPAAELAYPRFIDNIKALLRGLP
jgi:HK97 gp10 family phage protein